MKPTKDKINKKLKKIITKTHENLPVSKNVKDKGNKIKDKLLTEPAQPIR
jgi:hypothetical protein